jgi:hypothetical protein
MAKRILSRPPGFDKRKHFHFLEKGVGYSILWLDFILMNGARAMAFCAALTDDFAGEYFWRR